MTLPGRVPGIRLACLLAALCVVVVVAAGSCDPEGEEPVPLAPPDAGDEAFVRNVVPVLWGRNPESIREVDLLVQLLRQTNRETLVRSMTRSEEYVEAWHDVLLDTLLVNRVGDRAQPPCYGLVGDPSAGSELAAFVRDNTPDGGEFSTPWTMADLARSSLRLDDVSPLYRAHLFGQISQDFPLQGQEAAAQLRQNRFGVFERSYLSRNLVCLPCHNSEWSSTDHADPERDRFWPVPAYFEAAIFGDSGGRDPVDLHGFFRRHGVLAGFDMQTALQYYEPPTGCFGSTFAGCEGCACEQAVCDQMPECCDDRWVPQCADLCTDAGLGCIPGMPDGYEGCTALQNHPGCGGCACEAEVCEANPSCCSASWGIPCADLCKLLHPECVENLYEPPQPEGVAPWGVHPDCTILEPRASVTADPIAAEGWFGGPRGTEASMWDLEELLDRGFAQIRGGWEPPTDSQVGADVAFAWMVSSHFVEQVWAELYGEPLTVSHNYPRNAAQRDLLWGLTETFVQGGFSLQDVLVEATTGPYFNLAAPATVPEEQSPYLLPAFLNPWVISHDDEELRKNSIGELIHRKNPRVLVRTIAHAMGWSELPTFPTDAIFDDEVQLQDDLGFALKDSIHGFRGTDFQGLAGWENLYGVCRQMADPTDGCGSRLEPGCDGCPCEPNVCAARPSCCEVRWDPICGAFCQQTPQGCSHDGPAVWVVDWIDQILDAGSALSDSGVEVSLGDLVAALKDRILADPDISAPEERAALEALLGMSLSSVPESRAHADDALRWTCAALLASSQLQLAGDAGPDRLGTNTRVVVPGTEFEALCQRLGPILFGPDAVICTASTATLAAP